MIRSYWYVGLVAMAAVLAALGPYGAPLAVVGLAFGIFFGTVSIRGRLLSPSSLSSGNHRSSPSADATSTPPGV
jgi:hypothetical protein